MKGLFAFITAVLVVVPALSYPDVMVRLTNGREIIADTCEQDGGRLICTKMGGTFEIEKKDVLGIKEIKGVREGSLPAEKAAPAEPEKKRDNAPANVSPEKGVQGSSSVGQSEAMKRLEDIAQRKKELFSEREKLVKEREKLNADLNKAPDWMPTKQYDELNDRNARLTEKIRLFNEEAGRLSEEEKRIVEELKKKD